MSLIRVDWNPDKKTIRWFGLGLIVFGVLIGAWAFWKAVPALKIVAYVLAVAGVLTTAAPKPLGKPIYKAWMAVAFVISTVLSHVVLAVIYYGMITPLGLILRLFGRDSLLLKMGGQSSYWSDVAMPAGKEYYERLF